MSLDVFSSFSSSPKHDALVSRVVKYWRSAEGTCWSGQVSLRDQRVRSNSIHNYKLIFPDIWRPILLLLSLLLTYMWTLACALLAVSHKANSFFFISVTLFKRHELRFSSGAMDAVSCHRNLSGTSNRNFYRARNELPPSSFRVQQHCSDSVFNSSVVGYICWWLMILPFLIR